MRATYKYKVYTQNRNHCKRLEEYLRTASWVYNHCIALHKRYYRLYHKSLNVYALQAHLAKLKKRKGYEKWNVLSSQSIQQIAEKIGDGYKRFFKRQAKRPPGFRSWRKYRSVTFKNTGWTLKGNVFTINALHLCLKFHKSRELTGKIQTVTLKGDASGDWWICFSLKDVPAPLKKTAMTGQSAGFDFGLKTFLSVSDGYIVRSPRFFFSQIDQVRKQSRRLSKKQRGSNNRRKACLELSRLHRRIENKRESFHWSLAMELIKRYDVLYFENLNLKSMQMLWGRKISDLGFASFLNKVEYLCAKYDRKLVKIDRFYPSSKTCFDCGYIYKELSLKERSWICPECGQEHERDLNAAKNIQKAGASACAGEDVRPALAG